MHTVSSCAWFMLRASCILPVLILINAGSAFLPLSMRAQTRAALDAAVQTESWEECTIGVASGRATADGRPMIWKTRDTDNRDNAIYRNSSYRYRFLTIVDAGSRQNSWISLNEKGFAILNSALYDLTGGTSGLANGAFMTYAAGTCASVADFRRLLDSTNVTGRRTAANFAVMDSTGAAAIFETGGYAYWAYDALDTIACPRGYVLRTNFSFAGGGTEGLVRYQRTTALFDGFFAGDSITPKTILRYQMRDLADPTGVPYPLPYHGTVGSAPYGYIPIDLTICRAYTASAAVIQGVRPGESVQTSTFWAILGSPAAGITVPYWVACDLPLPSVDLPKAPLTNAANEIFAKIYGGPAWPAYLKSFLLRDDNGQGLFGNLFQAEDVILAAADSILSLWRQGQCAVSDMQRAESTYAAFALESLRAASGGIVDVRSDLSIAAVDGYALHQNYPNPFNPSTMIRYDLPGRSHITLTVYNRLGQQVSVLVQGDQDAGHHEVRFDGRNLASGVYFYQLKAHPLDFATARGSAGGAGDFVLTRTLSLLR
ncbi:MAG TPA: T9SS type A sorting domain-containing protein [Bacteroidota bacterium]|nr:T9SS type A sorting domain-containing protein [Bacteroidota bacterium]